MNPSEAQIASMQRKTESPVRKSTRTVLPAPTVICDVNDALVNLGYTEKTVQQAIIAVGPSATYFDLLLRATLSKLQRAQIDNAGEL